MDDESFNTTRSIATIVRASATSKGVLLQPPLNFSSVKRLIQVDEDERQRRIVARAGVGWRCSRCRRMIRLEQE